MEYNHRFALIAQMHPALNFSGGTANLIKTMCSYPGHPFCAAISADIAGPNPRHGPWDDIPTLALFRPRSLFPNLQIGLGLLDNFAYRLQVGRMKRFLKAQQVKRQFIIITNSTRFARLADRLPDNIPMDLYIIDDPAADAALYRMDERAAQETFDGLIAKSDRIFAISPVYASDIEARYQRPCSFLPLPIAGTVLASPDASLREEKKKNPGSAGTIVLHHSGQIHHLYADALAELAVLLPIIAEKRKTAILLELWGRLDRGHVGKVLNIDFQGGTEFRKGLFTVKLCGEVSRQQLALEQLRADFLLLVNSFLPQMERQIRCSFSSKICEYMVSGVPILVYAPSYSSLIDYLEQPEAAHLVSTRETEGALGQFETILFDSQPDRTVAAARALALEKHTGRAFFEQVMRFS
jgi:hypothetical protein